MDFLEKLDYLMEKNHLNKSTLSKACNIPYTTIDGWYKKGYEGLKLTTLRKLAQFFGTSLDYWACESAEPTNLLATSTFSGLNHKFTDVTSDLDIDDEVKQLAQQYSQLNDSDRELVKRMIDSLAQKTKSS